MVADGLLQGSNLGVVIPCHGVPLVAEPGVLLRGVEPVEVMELQLGEILDFQVKGGAGCLGSGQFRCGPSPAFACNWRPTAWKHAEN